MSPECCGSTKFHINLFSHFCTQWTVHSFMPPKSVSTKKMHWKTPYRHIDIKLSNTASCPSHSGPNVIRHFLAPPHSPPQNGTSIASYILTLQRHKFLIGYNWPLHIVPSRGGIDIQSAIFPQSLDTDRPIDRMDKSHTLKIISNNKPLKLYRTEQCGLTMLKIFTVFIIHTQQSREWLSICMGCKQGGSLTMHLATILLKYEL